MHSILPRTLRHILVGTAFLGALAGSVAQAGQFVVLDETWVHGPDMPDSHYRVGPIEGTPTDWIGPVDYSQGKAYVYLEVHSKPTEQPTKFQVCFEATPTYACTGQSPTYTTVGTYEWETDFAGFWSPPGETVDWSKGVNKIACILKDTENGKPSADNVGAEKAALYMPTEVRMVVTIVEPGSEYIPPIPTGEGTSTGDDSTGETGSTGGVTTGEPDTTGAPPTDTTTAPDPTTGADPVTTGGDVVTTDASGSSGPGPTTGPTGTTGADSATDSTPGASSDTGDTADHGEASSGCGCRSSGAPAPVSLALGVLVLGLVRRRRGHRPPR